MHSEWLNLKNGHSECNRGNVTVLKEREGEGKLHKFYLDLGFYLIGKIQVPLLACHFPNACAFGLLTLRMLGSFSCFGCRLTFFKINFLKKNLSGTLSECRKVNFEKSRCQQITLKALKITQEFKMEWNRIPTGLKST